MKLTRRVIDNASCEDGKPVYLWDGQLVGFGVKVLPSGTKRFLVKYRTYGGGRAAKVRWLTLGTHGQIPLESAREHARQVLAAVARGEDPQADRLALREAPRVQDVWERFEADHLHKRKASTIRDYRSVWRNDIEPSLGDLRVRDVSRQDVDRLHKQITKRAPTIANRVVAVLSKLMNLAEAWEWRDQGTNPCRYVEKNKETKRERYLSSAELKRLGRALNDLVDLGLVRADVARLFKLLLLTGARRSELQTCQWRWVDFDNRVIRLPDSKTGAKPLYLSDSALDVLRTQKAQTHQPESAFVFPGTGRGGHIINLSKPWKLICEEADLKDVRIHDLRHTAASIAVGQGVALPVIGRLLGHSQTQTTARYAHVDADPALSAANLIGEALRNSME